MVGGKHNVTLLLSCCSNEPIQFTHLFLRENLIPGLSFKLNLSLETKRILNYCYCVVKEGI